MSKPSPQHPITAAVLAVAVLAAAFFYYAVRDVNHDTGWFMYAARGMLNGGTLYRDFIDVNAPLAYYALLPAAWLSTLPAFSNEAALTANILLYILIGFLLSVAVMKQMGVPERTRIFLQTALLIIMGFMPHYAFGQREHIFAVLMLPYILAAAMRSENKALPSGLAIACGVAAAFGANIKPPFLIVPVFIEAMVLLRQRTWKVGLTYDVLAFAATTQIIYALSYLLYPDYWQNVLPSALALYGPYDNFQFLTDALFLQAPLFVAGLIAGEYRGREPMPASRRMLIAATLGAFALFILQRKGWPHHALPILIFMSTLFVFNLTDMKIWLAGNRLHAWLRGGVTAGVIACAFYLAFTGGNVNAGMKDAVEKYIQNTDGSFYIISTGNYPAFPLALNPRYRWTSRFPELIMLPGLIKADLENQPSPYEPGFRAAVLQDLQNGHPATIFVYTDIDAGGVDGQTMMDWLRHDPAFAKQWDAHYQWIGSIPPFAVYRRKS